MTIHTEMCVQETALAQARLDAYNLLYPHSCQACGGWGLQGEGGGYVEPAWIGICDACAGSCPRCSYGGWDDDRYDEFIDAVKACPICGFDHKEPAGSPFFSDYCDCGVVDPDETKWMEQDVWDEIIS